MTKKKIQANQLDPSITLGGVQSVVAGTNVTVDATDPANPVVSASGGGGGGAAEYTTIYTVDTGTATTTPLSAATLTFSTGTYKQIVIDAVVRPWADSVGGGTDVWSLRFNGASADYNYYNHTNYSADNLQSSVGFIKLNRVGAVDLLDLHVEINLSNLFNSVKSYANEGFNGSQVRESWTVGNWKPATPAAVTSFTLIASTFDDIGIGSHSTVIIKAK